MIKITKREYASIDESLMDNSKYTQDDRELINEFMSDYFEAKQDDKLTLKRFIPYIIAIGVFQLTNTVFGMLTPSYSVVDITGKQQMLLHLLWWAKLLLSTATGFATFYGAKLLAKVFG